MSYFITKFRKPYRQACFQRLYLQPPGWAFMLAAVGVFAYQCLDAMDGGQGRRMQAVTPLQELFDHGCDSFSSGQEVGGGWQPALQWASQFMTD